MKINFWIPEKGFNKRQWMTKCNRLKTKSFQVSKGANNKKKKKKVNILKTTMETHHDVYWMVNVIAFISITFTALKLMKN